MAKKGKSRRATTSRKRAAKSRKRATAARKRTAKRANPARKRPATKKKRVTAKKRAPKKTPAKKRAAKKTAAKKGTAKKSPATKRRSAKTTKTFGTATAALRHRAVCNDCDFTGEVQSDIEDARRDAAGHRKKNPDHNVAVRTTQSEAAALTALSHRAVCHDGDFTGPKRTNIDAARADASGHRKNQPDHDVEVLTTQS